MQPISPGQYLIQANPILKGWETAIYKAMQRHQAYPAGSPTTMQRHQEITRCAETAVQMASPKSFGRPSWTVEHDTGRETYTNGNINDGVTRLLIGFISRTAPRFYSVSLQNADRLWTATLTWRYNLDYGHVAFLPDPVMTPEKAVLRIEMDFGSPGRDHIEPIAVMISHDNYYFSDERLTFDSWGGEWRSEVEQTNTHALPESPVVQAIREAESKPEGDPRIRALIDALKLKQSGDTDQSS